MRQLLALLVLALLLPACRSAGIHAFASEHVPAAVRQSSAAALQMLTFPPDQVRRVSRPHVPKIIEALEQLRADGELDEANTRLYELLLADVQAAGEPRNIGIHGAGMSFLADDPPRLITCRHNLEGFGEFEKLAGQRVQIVLVDTQGAIVFDSREGRDTATVVRVGNPEDAAALDGDGPRLLATDWAILRLDPIPQGPRLRARATAAVVGESVFVPHYEFPDGWPPTPTPCISVGRIDRAPLEAASYGVHYVEPSDELARVLVQTTAFGGPGVSGAPIFDRDGALLGMVTTGREKRAAGIRGMPGSTH